MNLNVYNKWLNESSSKRSVYILVGPPAVGKSRWIEDHAPKDRVVISKDDIIEKVIFPNYKLGNKDIFEKPPEDMPVGSEHPEKKKLGKLISYKRFSRSKGEEVEERAFENAKAAGEELNRIYDSEIRQAISSGIKNIIVDATHMTRSNRKSSIDLFPSDQFKIIAVVFPHQGYEKQISKSAELRAKDFLSRFGSEFDRGISSEDYQKMYDTYQPPSNSEGIDEIVTYSRFKHKDPIKTDDKTLNEKLVYYTKKMLTEAKLSKYWKKRMESRSKRAKRELKNSLDKEWAEKQQDKSRKMNHRIHKFFEREVNKTDDLSEEIEQLLKKIKRKNRLKQIELQEKAKFVSPKQKRSTKTLPNPYKDSKVDSNFPFSKDRTGGVSKVYRKRSEAAGGSKKRNKASGGPTAAPGEIIGPGE